MSEENHKWDDVNHDFNISWRKNIEDFKKPIIELDLCSILFLIDPYITEAAYDAILDTLDVEEDKHYTIHPTNKIKPDWNKIEARSVEDGMKVVAIIYSGGDLQGMGKRRMEAYR